MTSRILAGCVLGLSAVCGQEVAVPTSVPVDRTFRELFPETAGPCELSTREVLTNFRAILDYDAPEPAELVLFGDHEVVLPAGANRRVEIACEHLEGRPARLRMWHEGILVEKGRDVPGTTVNSGPFVATPKDSASDFRFDRDFTVMVRFRTGKGGTLVAKAAPEGKWVPDAKALFIRGGRLVYDIGWLGAISGKRKVNDGKEHVAVLVVAKGNALLFCDGIKEAGRAGFTRGDKRGHVFKIGSAAPDFGGDYTGDILNVRFWKRALGAEEVEMLSARREDEVNTPDFNWIPPGNGGATVGTAVALRAGEGFRLRRALTQPLASADHAELVRRWDDSSVRRGREIYHQLCVTCHGTVEAPGSLPTALRFHEGQFRNGADPYRMFQTLEKGYGMMVAQPQYTTAQKYDVIHYLREEFLARRNPSQLAPVDDDYLAMLPRGMTLEREPKTVSGQKPYLAMDFGNVLFWTLQAEEGNIAQKGIAVRVDPGPGGISKGGAWMLYEHDTMRLAACWTGDQFVDWRGIAFDGSHGTHTSIVGEKHFVFPNAPAWANPDTAGFEDVRILGRDGKPYGPLPRGWVRFLGLDLHGGQAAIRYTVGDRHIREVPGRNAAGEFVRLMEVGPSSAAVTLKLDPERTHVFPPAATRGSHLITYRGGRAEVSPGKMPVLPAGRRFPGVLTTAIGKGGEDGPFAVDVLTPPSPGRNPWQSWMRTSGFDFFDDGKRAAVCTWNGDVWVVDGLDQDEGDLKWQRICAGLFQPLGVRIVDETIFVSCRDMIAVLRDDNGDGETDAIECFNNDHQVTEHFHEFAMGLQTDSENNFYYAKSARHALTAVVPHHGTLLRVSPDGSRTDIIATGFRAANGVCINPDGSFIVTDQEGHWNPKNRINWVQGGGPDDFYGNMYGYHGVTDESDEAMNPPLCWITNSFDRSPAELLWVPEDAGWGPLNGSLLNLSYGYGKIYVVPHEEVGGVKQGGMCELPMEQFPTGVMRGRFHPGDGHLYACGMFAWAGSQHQPGGFYRIRATGRPPHLPKGLSAAAGRVTVTFTDALDPDSATNPANYTVRAWDLKRTKNYGSKHYNEREWKVESVAISSDGRAVTLTIPDLAATWGMSIECRLAGADGTRFERLIHNTINVLED